MSIVLRKEELSSEISTKHGPDLFNAPHGSLGNQWHVHSTWVTHDFRSSSIVISLIHRLALRTPLDLFVAGLKEKTELWIV